jgi:hypothetical protein
MLNFIAAGQAGRVWLGQVLLDGQMPLCGAFAGSREHVAQQRNAFASS